MQRPFKIGDRITIAGSTGKVVTIGLRQVTVKPTSGELTIIPNKNFTGNALINIDARSDYYTKIPLPVSATNDADKLEQAVDILHEVAKAAADVEATHYVNFDKIPGDGSYTIELIVRVKKWKPEEKPKYVDDNAKMMTVPTKIRIDIIRRFAVAGIELSNGTTLGGDLKLDVRLLERVKASLLVA